MDQLFGAIPDALRGIGTNTDIEAALVFAAWSRSAGPLLMNRTKPFEFFANRLTVSVEDDLWRKHLEDLAPQLVAKINAQVGSGKLRYIEFRVDAETFEKDRRLRKQAKSLENAAAPRSVVESAQVIADENLRRAFLRAAALYLKEEDDT